MRGSRSRWIVAVATVALAVPVATAQGHPADWMYNGEQAKQIGATSGGVGTFMQREAAATPGSFTLVGHNPLRQEQFAGHEPDRAAARHERGDRRPQELRLRRQPDGRQATATPTTPGSWSSTSPTRRTRPS